MTSKTKYRDLSAAHWTVRLPSASVEMTFVDGWLVARMAIAAIKQRELDFDLPAFFVGAAPEFHGFGVVEDVAGFGVDG